jgi:NADPH2:quinone reductase
VRAVRLTSYGGLDGLELADLPEPDPRHGQVLIDVARAGVNYADVGRRRGTYDTAASLPRVLGGEVAGRRRDSGERVVALTLGGGGYAEVAAVDERLAFGIPDGIGDDEAIALLVQGVTAYHVVRSAGRLAEGESIVVHAAAGGVGSIAVQLARRWGAGRVIGVASTPAKRRLAEEHGAHVTVNAGPEALRDRLIDANGGQRVDVVLEMVGGEVFRQSLHALAPFGRIVVFGATTNESQDVPADELAELNVSVAGFWLRPLTERPEHLAGPLAELFEYVREGSLRPHIGRVYPLDAVREAHADLEERRSVGKLLLAPRPTARGDHVV